MSERPDRAGSRRYVAFAYLVIVATALLTWTFAALTPWPRRSDA